MYTKILLCCDFLMTRPETQRYHLRWFSKIIKTALQKATAVPASEFLSDLPNTFSRRDFFANSKVVLNEAESHFYFDGRLVSDKSIGLIKDALGEALVIGYELSEETRAVLDRANIIYIDVWLHPIRFMDDNFFAYRSNSHKLNAALQRFDLGEDIYYLYADKLKVQSYMGWDRYKKGLDEGLKTNSALFVGQTLTDKAVCRDGTMLNVLNFKDEFVALTNTFSHVYFSRHPMIKGDDKAQLDFVLSYPNVSLTTEPGYKLLCSESISHVTGISSSLMYESKFFGKSYSYLYRPVLEVFSRKCEGGYYSIFSKLHSPAFWSSVLGRVVDVFSYVPEYDFLSNSSNYRDMLALYYNTHVFDRNYAIFSKGPDKSASSKKAAIKERVSSDRLVANPPSFKKLESLIDQCQVVSFDVFDTLLQRKVFVPGDVINLVAYRANREFGIVIDDFILARREAKRHSTKHEVPLFERYEIIGRILSLDSIVWKRLYEFEIQVEKGLLEARLIGKAAFDYARSCGKRIVVTSDTYFTKSQIQDFLSAAEMDPDEFYVSSEHDATKENGSLYSVLLANESGSILHVGDNYKADIVNSAKHNIPSAWIVSNYEQLKGSTPGFVKSEGPYGPIKNGLIQRAITAYPAVTKGAGYTSGKSYRLGYSIVGDMMLSFAAWIIEKAKVDGVKTLYFLARDGEIVKKAADEILSRTPGSVIRTEYLLASRRATRVSSLRNREDVHAEIVKVVQEYSKNPNQAELTKYLQLRFGFLPKALEVLGLSRLLESIVSSPVDKSPQLLQSWLSGPDVIDAVLANAAEERELYTKYLERIGFGSESTVGVVDIGHNGSLQASLAKMCELNTTRGYYFCTYSGIDETLGAIAGDHQGTGFYRDRLSTSDRSEKYIRYALVIESLFLNDKGTFLHFSEADGELVPHFLEGGENARITFNKNIHLGSADYCKDVLDVVGESLGHLEVSHLWMHGDACTRLFSMLEGPVLKDAEVFSGITIENYFAGRPLRYFVPPKRSLDVSPVLWKEGTTALRESMKTANEVKEKSAASKEKKIIVNPGKQFRDLERSARELYNRRCYKEAANEFWNAYRENPGRPNLLRAASEAFLSANDRRSALETLKLACKEMPKNKKLKRRLLVIKYPYLRPLIGSNEFVV